MSNIPTLLEVIRQTPRCMVLPPSGQPVIRADLSLPPDLHEFYELAGGAVLYKNEDGDANRIVTPESFTPGDLNIWGEIQGNGPESAWYAVADVGEGNFLMIDLDPARAGLCYDAFHETYREPGYMTVVADSFMQMLERLYLQGNNRAYWLDKAFHSTRDAYDLL